MGAKVSKRFYSFRPISAKHYEGIGYYRGIQAVPFLGHCDRNYRYLTTVKGMVDSLPLPQE